MNGKERYVGQCDMDKLPLLNELFVKTARRPTSYMVREAKPEEGVLDVDRST